jgi:hypothetical protein
VKRVKFGNLLENVKFDISSSLSSQLDVLQTKWKQEAVFQKSEKEVEQAYFIASTNPWIAHSSSINKDPSFYFNTWTNMYDFQ